METFIYWIRTHVLRTIIEGLFDSPQTLNGHVKKGTGSLIQLPGVTTVKWLHIGAALMFLSHTPSLNNYMYGCEYRRKGHSDHTLLYKACVLMSYQRVEV